MEDDPDLEKAYEELSKEDRVEFEEIQKALIELQDDLDIIKEKEIKQRLAKLCLKLVNETPLDYVSIQETSYILTGFIFYHFDDELDDIISNFGELELPKDLVDGDVFKRWEENKKLIENYLEK